MHTNTNLNQGDQTMKANPEFSKESNELAILADQECVTIESVAERMNLSEKHVHDAQRIWKQWRADLTVAMAKRGVHLVDGNQLSYDVETLSLPADIVARMGKKKGSGTKPVRAKAFGYSVCAVLRWMGANGWADRVEDATIAICTVSENYKISDVTIKLQLKAGARMVSDHDWDTMKMGKVAPLTEAEGRALERASE